MTTAFGDALLLEEGIMNDEEHEMTVDNYNPDYSAPLTPTPDYSHDTDYIAPEEDDPTEPSEERSPDEIEDELRFLGLDNLLCKLVEPRPDVELLDVPGGDDPPAELALGNSEADRDAERDGIRTLPSSSC